MLVVGGGRLTFFHNTYYYVILLYWAQLSNIIMVLLETIIVHIPSRKQYKENFKFIYRLIRLLRQRAAARRTFYAVLTTCVWFCLNLTYLLKNSKIFINWITICRILYYNIIIYCCRESYNGIILYYIITTHCPEMLNSELFGKGGNCSPRLPTRILSRHPNTHWYDIYYFDPSCAWLCVCVCVRYTYGS